MSFEAAEWWEPDEVILDAVCARRVQLADIDATDQCWVVARLSERGWSTLEIAEAIACSQRQVKRIRAKVLTQQFRRVMRLEGAQEQLEQALARAERNVVILRQERDQLRGVLGRGGDGPRRVYT